MGIRCVILALVAGGCWGCIPPTADPPPAAATVSIDLQSPGVRQVYQLSQERRADSLLTYLTAPDRSTRYLAAHLLGSLPKLTDPQRDTLGRRLSAAQPLVRAELAYALGQLGRPEDVTILTAAFDPGNSNSVANAAILQAMGRLGNRVDAERLATISTYTASDTTLSLGRVYGLLYAALRDQRSPVVDAAVVDLLTDSAYPPQVRRVAAQYAQRIEMTVDIPQQRQLLKLLRDTDDPLLAMGVARAAGRLRTEDGRVALLRRLEEEPDWRVRVEVLRALADYNYASVREPVIDALRDPHPLVAGTAADWLLEHGSPEDAPLYSQLATPPLLPAVQTTLLAAANRHLSPYLTDYRDRINNRLRQEATGASDPYTRAAAIRALGEFPWMYRVVYDYAEAFDHPAVRTAIAETLQGIAARADYTAFFRASAGRVRRELAGSFRAFIESGEEGPAYHAARALTAQPEAYRNSYADLDWLTEAMDRMELPRQLETYREVAAARAALAGTPAPPPAAAPPPSQLIDWELLHASTDRTIRLSTTAGEISLRLWPTVAPATVSSFLRFVQEGYYDGKVFHRVVPNFVAQGGGPRGDGFGSETFTLPTETPNLHWDRAGLIGMASAGRDTEGVQFFLTHRPTPHLDGQYTIFGEVTEGQDVVDQLIPGSRIERIQVEEAMSH